MGNLPSSIERGRYLIINVGNGCFPVSQLISPDACRIAERISHLIDDVFTRTSYLVLLASSFPELTFDSSA